MEALLSISIILVVMIVIIALKINLGYSILSGILLCTILFNRGLGLFSDVFQTISSLSNITLILSVILIFFLARILDEGGTLKRMLTSSERFLRKTWLVIIAIPMVIGIVPTPSGAILSAPFVAEVGKKARLSNLRQLTINYWFRHSISEYINPIFPGVLLAASVAGISFGSFALLNLPLMMFATAIGLLFFVKGIPQRDVRQTHKKDDLLNIGKVVFPLLIALLLPTLFAVNLAIAMLVAVAFTIVINKVYLKKLWGLFVKSFKLDLIVLIALILTFKTVLENSKAMELVAESLIRLHFPSIILIILVPMVIAFITGITIAFVGVSFPLLLPFIKVNGHLNLGLLMLAYEAGYLGVMMSPMHLCLSATAQYFKVEYKEVFKKLLLPQFIIFGFAVLLYFIGWPFF